MGKSGGSDTVGCGDSIKQAVVEAATEIERATGTMTIVQALRSCDIAAAAAVVVGIVGDVVVVAVGVGKVESDKDGEEVVVGKQNQKAMLDIALSAVVVGALVVGALLAAVGALVVAGVDVVGFVAAVIASVESVAGVANQQLALSSGMKGQDQSEKAPRSLGDAQWAQGRGLRHCADCHY